MTFFEKLVLSSLIGMVAILIAGVLIFSPMREQAERTDLLKCAETGKSAFECRYLLNIKN